MSIPDIETLMATRPCPGYPRARVERVLEACGHPQTWEAFAERVRDRGWETAGYEGVSLRGLLVTALRSATRAQRRIFVVRATHLRVEAQVFRWPEVTPAVADVRRRLLAWQGDREEIREIRGAAGAACHAAYAAAAASYADAELAAELAASAASAADAADAADAASDAADYTSPGALAAASAYAYADAWDGLLYACRLLDGTEVKP